MHHHNYNDNYHNHNDHNYNQKDIPIQYSHIHIHMYIYTHMMHIFLCIFIKCSHIIRSGWNTTIFQSSHLKIRNFIIILSQITSFYLVIFFSFISFSPFFLLGTQRKYHGQEQAPPPFASPTAELVVVCIMSSSMETFPQHHLSTAKMPLTPSLLSRRRRS